MSDERDQETTSRKVTSNSNTPLNRYSTSEERTTKVKDDGSSNAVIVFVLLFLAVGAGAVAYYLNNRPAPAPILVPSAVDTVKENKSTIIERNTYGSLIFERGGEIGLKLEDEQRCKRKDRKSRRYTTAICRTEANGSPRATR